MDNAKQKTFFKSSVGVLLLVGWLSSCVGRQDPFVGRWTVEKVNVEFREDLATPEMVRQYGELEKGNVLEIGADSVLTLVSGGDTLRGNCSLKGGQLILDGRRWGSYERGRIRTETPTALGTVEVIYIKKPN